MAKPLEVSLLAHFHSRYAIKILLIYFETRFFSEELVSSFMPISFSNLSDVVVEPRHFISGRKL